MGTFVWRSNIGEISIEDLKLGLQNLTGLNNIIIDANGISKSGFNSAIWGILIENKELSIYESLDGPTINRYLDCSFYHLLKKMGYPTKRSLPEWSGKKWEQMKQSTRIRIRK